MLQAYLNKNFHEQSDFINLVQLSADTFNSLLRDRVIPTASYIVEADSNCGSFISDYKDTYIYRYHLDGHASWVRAIGQLDLKTEKKARAYFEARYMLARSAFFSSEHGKSLVAAISDVEREFDKDHAEATWGHFLNGVYGVCTRDGQPESIFLKQVGVMFIERFTIRSTGHLSEKHLALLKQTVLLLDSVESEFAPHEVTQSSRQRCIIDVKTRYFSDLRQSEFRNSDRAN